MTQSRGQSCQNAESTKCRFLGQGILPRRWTQAEGDATEEDKINFQSLRDAATGSSTDAVPLTVENPSPEDEAEHRRKLHTEKTAAFISSAPTTLKRLMDRAVDMRLRLLEPKAGASEFTTAIGEKAVCVRKKTAKLVTMMDSWSQNRLLATRRSSETR